MLLLHIHSELVEHEGVLLCQELHEKMLLVFR